ncbi:hypothetical protein pb186bvf_003988 [Paramecium bursaria]
MQNQMQMEEMYLNENCDVQYFDKNYLIINEKKSQLEDVFDINLNDNDADIQKQGKLQLIKKFLQYDIGLNIIQKLLFRRNQVQINGVYYFLAVNDLQMDLELLFQRFYYDLISENQFNADEINSQHRVMQNIILLLKSIIMRKEKELKMSEQSKYQLNEQVEEDIQRTKDLHLSFSNKFIIILNLETIKTRGQQTIYKLCQISEKQLISRVLKQKEQQKLISRLNNDYKIEDLIVLLETYTTFELYLLLSRMTKLQLSHNIIRQIKFIYDLDNKEEFETAFSELEYLFAQQPQLRKIILKYLYENKFKYIQDALCLSQIDWNDQKNFKIITKILIRANKIQNAYCFVNYTKDDNNFQYLCIKLNQVNKLMNLIKQNLNFHEDELLSEFMINNVLQHENFVFYLLKKQNFKTAIEFCNSYNQELAIVVDEWTQNHIQTDDYNKQDSQTNDIYDQENSSPFDEPDYSFLIPTQYQKDKKNSKRVAK